MIGDALVKSDNDQTFWLAALMPKAEKLNAKDLKQQAAVPLSSFLRFDPWTDQVITMHTAFEPILSPSDKMPFEVAPVYIKLAYYKPPTDPSAAPPAATPGAAPAETTAAPQANEPNAAPAPATTAPPPSITAPLAPSAKEK